MRISLLHVQKGERQVISKQKLTESVLFYLLRRQGKNLEQFNHYFDQYFSHGRVELGEDFETAKVMFETFEKIRQCIITSADSRSSLWNFEFR